MLNMIHGNRETLDRQKMRDSQEPSVTEKEIVSMKDAAWPSPFLPGLEYNSPAHGTWNIVHTGMLIPGSHQIYVCAANCNRGVILTAAEMGAVDRFSTIALCEEDITDGRMEELVIDGVSEILHKLKRKPTVVLLFTVCLHHFMGCDIPYIYRTLRERFPEQRFLECYMDPIMQKGGMTPDQKLRMSMYNCLEERNKNPRQISIIGNDLALQPDCEMFDMLKTGGYTVKDITACKTFEEYLSMSESFLNIVTYPSARAGGEKLSQRLGMKFLYLPQTFDYEEIDRELLLLAETVGLDMPDTAVLKEKCEVKLEETRKLLDGMPVAVDAAAAPRVLGLARLLLSHGFSVIRIYADSFSPEEKADYQWLKAHAPEVEVCATIHTGMRVLTRRPERVLAIGQKAAYFHQTGHFVNMVEGGGLYGYAGIMELCERIGDAFYHAKDTKDLIVRKGLGCMSCI